MAEKMKPSGIDWIGDVPNEWDITKVKYRTSQIGSGTTPDSGNPLYYEDGCFPWIQSGDLYNADYIRDTEKKITELAVADFNALTWYEKEFVVVAMYGASVGNIAISQISSYTNQACCVLKAKDDDLRYLFYFLSAGKENMLQMAFGGTQPNISQAIIKNLPFLDVSHNEQQAIADFLDKECAQIDSIAADLEKQIALLQQYKKSLITETVTKGLDKSAPMKDSGNSIIGSVNCCYTTKKLKYIVETPITDGTHETPALVDDGIPFLSAESVKNGILDFEYKRGYISESDHKFFCKKIKPQKNDVFIVKSGATTGNVGIVTVDQEFSIWSPLALIRCDDKTVLQKFIYYCVGSNYFKHEIEQAWSYGTQQNIGMGVIENLTVVIPPIDEQKKIVHYLDDVLASMDEMIIDKTKQLEIIQQHKKSFIYEYVTGKKRVKEVR